MIEMNQPRKRNRESGIIVGDFSHKEIISRDLAELKQHCQSIK